MGELREAITTGRGRHRGGAGARPAHRRAGLGRGAAALAPPRARNAAARLVPRCAERNGLIIPLTELVLDRAVGACARWQEVGLEIGISVNLSARSLMDQRLPSTVAAALRRYHLPAHLLTLEITESIVISDAGRAVRLLDELRALGVRLSLDDFGTGYSSLTYLSSLPIQQLKIDQSFVADILTSPRDAAIVTSMIDLAHHLGLQIVAEGIDDPGVRERLQRLGCDLGQGLPVRAVDGPATCCPSGTCSRSRDDVLPGTSGLSGRSSASCGR